MRFVELVTISHRIHSYVRRWNEEDDRITILTLKALENHMHRTLSNSVSGVAVAIVDDTCDGFLGLSWTLRLLNEWRSATIIDRSIRGRGYGSALFRLKVALFRHRTGLVFPEVTLDPNNEVSYNMVINSGISIRPNPERKEI